MARPSGELCHVTSASSGGRVDTDCRHREHVSMMDEVNVHIAPLGVEIDHGRSPPAVLGRIYCYGWLCLGCGRPAVILGCGAAGAPWSSLATPTTQPLWTAMKEGLPGDTLRRVDRGASSR